MNAVVKTNRAHVERMFDRRRASIGLVLVVNAMARAKLEGRGITRRDVEQVIANGALIIDNPQARLAGSVFAIGHTDAVRFVTLVLQPDESRPTRWHVMTGWNSTTRQITAYQRSR